MVLNWALAVGNIRRRSLKGDEKNSCGCCDGTILLLLLESGFLWSFSQNFSEALLHLFAFLRSFESLWWGKGNVVETQRARIWNCWQKCNFKPFQTLILPFESGNPKSRITWKKKFVNNKKHWCSWLTFNNVSVKILWCPFKYYHGEVYLHEQVKDNHSLSWKGRNKLWRKRTWQLKYNPC